MFSPWNFSRMKPIECSAYLNLTNFYIEYTSESDDHIINYHKKEEVQKVHTKRKWLGRNNYMKTNLTKMWRKVEKKWIKKSMQTWEKRDCWDKSRKFEKRIKRSTTHASGRRTRKTMEEKWLIKKTNSKKEYDDIEKKGFFKYKKIWRVVSEYVERKWREKQE